TGLHVEFADGVDDRKEGNLTGLGLENGDAVVEIFVGARTAAAQARQGGPRGKSNKIDEGTAVERKRRDGSRIDDGVEGCGLGAQQGGVFLDHDAGGDGANGQRDVYADSFAGADSDVLAFIALEGVLFHGKRVPAGFETRPLINAIFVGLGFVEEIGTFFGERDFRAGDDSPARIEDLAG